MTRRELLAIPLAAPVAKVLSRSREYNFNWPVPPIYRGPWIEYINHANRTVTINWPTCRQSWTPPPMPDRKLSRLDRKLVRAIEERDA